MRVVHVITTINRGGAENHLVDLIRGQSRHYGVEVVCAYLKGDSYWAEELSAIGCEVHALHLNYYGQLGPLLKLRRLIRENAPHIVHAHLAPAELYARFALLQDEKTPLLISRHNHSRFYGGPFASQIERWVISRTNRVIGISESVRRHFSSLLPELENRFEVVPYGIDPSSITSVAKQDALTLRREWHVEPDAILLGTVARLVPVKALHILLEGFARLRDSIAHINVKLVVVGAGPLEANLKSHANDLGLDYSVIWAGFREDIPVVMNALDIFVLTSLSEGFGLVLLEAMAASKPIISTNVSALPEIVMEGKTGMMVPPYDVSALAQKMQLLVEDAGLRKTLGKAGYERALSDFSLEVMYRKTMTIYESILREDERKE